MPRFDPSVLGDSNTRATGVKESGGVSHFQAGHESLTIGCLKGKPTWAPPRAAKTRTILCVAQTLWLWVLPLTAKRGLARGSICPLLAIFSKSTVPHISELQNLDAGRKSDKSGWLLGFLLLEKRKKQNNNKKKHLPRVFKWHLSVCFLCPMGVRVCGCACVCLVV